MYDDPKCQQNDSISIFLERFVNQYWTGTLRVEHDSSTGETRMMVLLASSEKE